MTRNLNIILLIAIIGIGFYILPSTLSMFAGQHSWYAPSERGIPCDKCHFLEEEELMSGGPHSTLYGGASKTTYNTSANYNGTSGFVGGSVFWGGDDISDRCYGCHQVGANYPVSSPLNASNSSWGERNDTVHAAVVIYCVDCHSWVDDALDDSLSAHKEFYSDFNTTESGLLKGGNKACIGCHTGAGVNISWSRSTNITFTADESNGDWAIDSMDATGTVTNFTSTK
jgi:hypothetical protein